ncbi:hypothetical protein [Vulcanisaeta souniana]|uniref:Uncharacterized protein n=2 Tax=Vulcanisaeta souniana TaxID=164452 RepID=A0A830EDQ4_9CREN|nr:hypothetical protein [Vulcanisaeta souniana]BDR92389.1 hypothetical protein Vsou_14820 [Vulcanisaeta souniana JCM 11219]GGI75199.1 hypothetical protein GCM10007112_10010 [Vulcanisaeta souniana JCM 11219]
MRRGVPAYVLGGLIILMGFLLSISLILSIPSPLTAVTGYLNLTANAYLGLGNNLLVIVGVNNFNFPITELNLYIPSTGTNITISTKIPSSSYFLVMIYQGVNSTVITAPGLTITGNPGNLANLTRSNSAYGLNATTIVYDVTKKSTFQLTTQDSGIIYAVPLITNLTKPALGIYVFQMTPMGNTEITGFNMVSISQQFIGEVKCNISEPITITPNTPIHFTINITTTNGTLKPLGIWYTCNATPTSSLPSLLYLNLALKYDYTYNSIVINREDWFSVYIVPMQMSNT